MLSNLGAASDDRTLLAQTEQLGAAFIDEIAQTRPAFDVNHEKLSLIETARSLGDVSGMRKLVDLIPLDALSRKPILTLALFADRLDLALITGDRTTAHAELKRADALSTAQFSENGDLLTVEKALLELDSGDLTGLAPDSLDTLKKIRSAGATKRWCCDCRLPCQPRRTTMTRPSPAFDGR